MPAIAIVPGSAVRTSSRRIQAMPDPLPKPPGRPPGEPIIIRNPPRPPDGPEIDHSDDEEDEPEIKKPPDIVPEKRPPPAPWERADRPTGGPRPRRAAAEGPIERREARRFGERLASI